MLVVVEVMLDFCRKLFPFAYVLVVSLIFQVEVWLHWQKFLQQKAHDQIREDRSGTLFITSLVVHLGLTYSTTLYPIPQELQVFTL